MYEYRVHTLVDITQNGSLNKAFPFKTLSGEVVHDKDTLRIARDQNNNWTTVLQLLQMRGNVIWENPPVRIHDTIGNSSFGTAYEGKQMSWHFTFFTEQNEVYGDINDPTGSLLEDFNLVPVINFCQETATFPTSTFITLDPATKNTYFSYAGESNK